MRIFNTPQDALNFIMSLIGCATGVASLTITIIKWVLERPKEKIEPFATSLCGFYKHPPNEHIKTEYAIIYYLTISNIRQVPFSIKKVRLTIKDINLPTSQSLKLEHGIMVVDELNGNKLKSFTLADSFEYLHSPRMIKPFETVNFCFMFTSGDAVYELYQQHKQSGKDALPVNLRISLTHKEIVKRIELKELTYDSIKSQWNSYKGAPEDYDITATILK